MNFTLSAYLPVLLMFIVAAGFAITMVVLSQFVGQRKRTRTKLMPYECGKDPVGSARERFSVKFYLIAMLFILFDIEVVFKRCFLRLLFEINLLKDLLAVRGGFRWRVAVVRGR